MKIRLGKKRTITMRLLLTLCVRAKYKPNINNNDQIKVYK